MVGLRALTSLASKPGNMEHAVQVPLQAVGPPEHMRKRDREMKQLLGSRLDDVRRLAAHAGEKSLDSRNFSQDRSLFILVANRGDCFCRVVQVLLSAFELIGKKPRLSIGKTQTGSRANEFLWQRIEPIRQSANLAIHPGHPIRLHGLFEQVCRALPIVRGECVADRVEAPIRLFVPNAGAAMQLRNLIRVRATRPMT